MKSAEQYNTVTKHGAWSVLLLFPVSFSVIEYQLFSLLDVAFGEKSKPMLTIHHGFFVMLDEALFFETAMFNLTHLYNRHCRFCYD